MPQECAVKSKDRLAKDVILSKIPAFPPVVLKALDLLATDRTGIAELARLIASDATLSAQVLRMANSALFGFTSPRSIRFNTAWWRSASPAYSR